MSATLVLYLRKKPEKAFPNIYLDNLCFSLDQRIAEVWRSKAVREGVRREYADILGKDVFDTRIDCLSEKQKYDLVYTRVLIQKPQVVFCVQPFWRADMALRMHIWDLLKMLMDKKIAVVVLTVNLADSLSLADKLIKINGNGEQEIYLRSQFSQMTLNAPWVDLYRQSQHKSKATTMD